MVWNSVTSVGTFQFIWVEISQKMNTIYKITFNMSWSLSWADFLFFFFPFSFFLLIIFCQISCGAFFFAMMVFTKALVAKKLHIKEPFWGLFTVFFIILSELCYFKLCHFNNDLQVTHNYRAKNYLPYNNYVPHNLTPKLLYN